MRHAVCGLRPAVHRRAVCRSEAKISDETSFVGADLTEVSGRYAACGPRCTACGQEGKVMQNRKIAKLQNYNLMHRRSACGVRYAAGKPPKEDLFI